LVHPRIARRSHGLLRARLKALGGAIWRALEHEGRRRARLERLALAERWQTSDPELAEGASRSRGASRRPT
jgi:hypothetical protein